MDELQAAMIVVPAEALYSPTFTYIWTLASAGFRTRSQNGDRNMARDTALREIARAFLACAGMTTPGELARVTGLSRRDAGRGNRALVAENYATMLGPGIYRLASAVVPVRGLSSSSPL